MRRFIELLKFCEFQIDDVIAKNRFLFVKFKFPRKILIQIFYEWLEGLPFWTVL